MQLNLKYKIFKQLKRWNLIEWYPKRLKNSTKEQWRSKTLFNKFKSIRLKKQRHKDKAPTLRLNTLWKSVNTLPKKRWSYHKKFYYEGLTLKRYYYYFFSLGLSNKYIKSLYNNVYFQTTKLLNTSYFNFLLKPYYRLDILLKVLGFSNSSFEIRNAVRNNSITVLHKTSSLSPSYELQLGDIVNIKYSKLKFSFTNTHFKRVFLKKQFNLFCEIDYYTRTLIMTSSFNSIFYSCENPQIFFKKFNIHKFISYLKSEH